MSMKSSYFTLAVVIALLSGTDAQVRDCDTVVTDLSAKQIRIFENVPPITANIAEELCVNFTSFR